MRSIVRTTGRFSGVVVLLLLLWAVSVDAGQARGDQQSCTIAGFGATCAPDGSCTAAGPGSVCTTTTGRCEASGSGAQCSVVAPGTGACTASGTGATCNTVGSS